MSKVDSIDTSKLQLQTRQSSSINLRTIICFSAYRSACFERDISQRKQCEAENRRRLSSCVLTEQACAARGNAASALLCDFAVLGEVNTVCFCRCSASQAACVPPPHFNSLFCLPLLSSVRQQLSPSFSACKEPLFNHSDILSACRNLLF